jgi:uncharacterized damage-inducible protein DinB
MLDHFRRQFAYDDWANREVLASLRAAGTPPPRALELTAHILSAQYVWLARLRGETQPFPVWPVFTLEQCEAHATELAILWTRYLEDLRGDGLASVVSYENTFGESWSNRVPDILTHVIMHSVYHRGQVALVMRTAGFTPAYTDFIHSVRQGFVE